MTKLSAELYKLWYAGKVELPTVAATYGEAAQQLHVTGLDDAGAFSGGQGSGTFGGSWAAMRNMFQDQVLCTTAENLTDTGAALTAIALDYAKADGQTGDDLQTSIDGLADSGLDQPPVYVPEPPRHTDPHPEEYPPYGPGI